MKVEIDFDLNVQPHQWLVALATKHHIDVNAIVEMPGQKSFFVLKHEGPATEKDQDVPKAYLAIAEETKQQLNADGWVVEKKRCNNHVLYAKGEVRVGVLTVTTAVTEDKPDSIVMYGVYTYKV